MNSCRELLDPWETLDELTWCLEKFIEEFRNHGEIFEGICEIYWNLFTIHSKIISTQHSISSQCEKTTHFHYLRRNRSSQTHFSSTFREKQNISTDGSSWRLTASSVTRLQTISARSIAFTRQAIFIAAAASSSHNGPDPKKNVLPRPSRRPVTNRNSGPASPWIDLCAQWFRFLGKSWWKLRMPNSLHFLLILGQIYTNKLGERLLKRNDDWKSRHPFELQRRQSVKNCSFSSFAGRIRVINVWFHEIISYLNCSEIGLLSAL